MSLFELIARESPAAADMLHRIGDRLRASVSIRRDSATTSKALVFWGGGKDSTLALIFAKALSESTGITVRAVTMDNPGITAGTQANIVRVSRALGIEHEYWHFCKSVPQLGTELTSWQRLYRALAIALGGEPRFMCIACNFGSIVTEYSALSHHRAAFCITGNPAWELATFERWITALRNEFEGYIDFPRRTGKIMLDYYRFWHAIYDRLLDELFPKGDEENFTADDAKRLHLYTLPSENDEVAQIEHLNVLGDESLNCVTADHQSLLASVGWRFPDDMQGGTESDCAFTASIAHLNISRVGLEKHLKDLEEAKEYFRPPTEMTDRAKQWALSGKSNEEGRKLFPLLGLGESFEPAPPRGSAVAKALIDKLFRIR